MCVCGGWTESACDETDSDDDYDNDYDDLYDALFYSHHKSKCHVSLQQSDSENIKRWGWWLTWAKPLKVTRAEPDKF